MENARFIEKDCRIGGRHSFSLPYVPISVSLFPRLILGLVTMISTWKVRSNGTSPVTRVPTQTGTCWGQSRPMTRRARIASPSITTSRDQERGTTTNASWCYVITSAREVRLVLYECVTNLVRETNGKNYNRKPMPSNTAPARVECLREGEKERGEFHSNL